MLYVDDGSRMHHTDALGIYFEQDVVDYGAICRHVLDHENAIGVEVDAEVLVAYALARFLAKDDIGGEGVAAENEA